MVSVTSWTSFWLMAQEIKCYHAITREHVGRDMNGSQLDIFIVGRWGQVLVTYSSTYVLVALSIDRYDAICHPMNFSRGCKYSLFSRFLLRSQPVCCLDRKRTPAFNNLYYNGPLSCD